MQRIDNSNDDLLIDLGSVVEETKGNRAGAGDTIVGLQQGSIGLTDD